MMFVIHFVLKMSCITTIEDINNIIINHLKIKDIIAVSRTNKESYNSIKNNILYKEITQLTSAKFMKDIFKKGLLQLLIHVNNYSKVKNIVYHAAINNQVKILEWYCKDKEIKINRKLIDDICFHDCVDVIDWFYNNTNNFVFKNAIEHALKNGCIKVLDWFNEHHFYKYNNYYNMVVYRADRITSLKWLIKTGFVYNHVDIGYLLTHRQTDMLNCFYNYGLLHDYYNHIKKFIMSINMNDKSRSMYNWSLSIGYDYTQEDIMYMIDKDYVGAIMMFENYPFDEEILSYARKKNNHVTKWFIEQGYLLDEITTYMFGLLFLGMFLLHIMCILRII